MDFTTTIQVSQMIVNELAGSAFVHKMQGQLFKSRDLRNSDRSTSTTTPRKWNG